LKTGWIIALFVAALASLIAYSTMNGPRYRLQLCMAYDGHTSCKSVSAKSETGALRSAAENACADIASGVTDTMRCEQTPPKSVKWLQRPQ